MFRLFGTTLIETINALFPRPHLGKQTRDPNFQRALMRVVVSLAVLFTGILLLTSHSDVAKVHLGFSLVSLVAGYWLK